MPKWVDLVGYDTTAKAFKPVARAILLDDGVRIDGPSDVVSSLEQGVEDPITIEIVYPADGEAFLLALQRAYSNPMIMQATDIQEGAAPPPLAA